MGTVAIFGAGVMGETLLSGLLRAGRAPGDLVITLGCGDVTIVGPLLADLLKQRPDAAS